MQAFKYFNGWFCRVSRVIFLGNLQRISDARLTREILESERRWYKRPVRRVAVVSAPPTMSVREVSTSSA